ncbi:hypothetical protein D9M69_574140 [compost metagenome]
MKSRSARLKLAIFLIPQFRLRRGVRHGSKDGRHAFDLTAGFGGLDDAYLEATLVLALFMLFSRRFYPWQRRRADAGAKLIDPAGRDIR